MHWLLFGSTLLIPAAMAWGSKDRPAARLIASVGALIAAIAIGNLIAAKVYDVLSEHTVFMTTIHALLLNPWFLTAGAYLGLYLIYRIWLLIFQRD
ncbi:transposase [Cohnella boryungensis]|uniref:Transposase n=1 Tax=Cohnella boryungensis TaxID=768479 RepID=A0ABV8SJD2_9BACL